MRKTFFSRHALLVLCIVFFLIPFGLRGARLSMSRTKNDVTDWLPDSFAETQELQWFAKHFVGERFVVASWPGCTEHDPRYQKMLDLILDEIEPSEAQPLPADPIARDDELARRLGAELGLFYDGDYRENWGGRGERWLRGAGSDWYFLTPDGKLWKWTATDSVPGRMIRGLRVKQGRKVDGTLVAKWAPSQPARYFDDPRRLQARLFRTVVTGPLAVEQMAAEGGALWPQGNHSDERKRVIARRRATERLEGTLFGQIVPDSFTWTVESLDELIPDDARDQLPAQWEEVAEERLDAIARIHFGGSREKLAAAPAFQLVSHWYELCDELNIEPLAPATCFFVTLSEPGDKNLSRVCGRQAMGKPRGQLLALADAAGVPAIGADSVLHIGGPPVDNVAIDEEGSITLVRLVGYSAAIGFVLSFLSFRSIKVTIMVFLVGGVAAMTSLAIVYWSGDDVDAVLLSMPSLVYVLGLSGAVHIVNYYRDAAQETGEESAATRALQHGWGPCTLAAFTTALGLLSLCASNILPIRKFGWYSALGVMATLTLLFSYLPAALTIWPPGYGKGRKEGQKKQSHGPESMSGLAAAVGRFWDRVGDFVTVRYGWVIASTLILMALLSLGLFKIRTSVQLLELFDKDAKIIRDYAWLEDELGELVPMEVVVRVPKSKIRRRDLEGLTPDQQREESLRLSLAQRVEMADTIQRVIEGAFGPTGKGYVGRGLSVATFAHNSEEELADTLAYSAISSRRLEERYDELLKLDYLRIDDSEDYPDAELWRISLRLGALNGVDYGEFVHELADAVEPALAAYRDRDAILQKIDDRRRSQGLEGGYADATVLLLGAPEPFYSSDADATNAEQDASLAATLDQTKIYSETLQRLLEDADLIGESAPMWYDPGETPLAEMFATPDEFAAALEEQAECVVLVRDHADLDVEFLKQHALTFVDGRSHQYQRAEDPTAALAAGGSAEIAERNLTAAQRGGDEVHAIYTGVIPVVYKAQRTLLYSLAESIGWAFVMIAAVMMVLLRTKSSQADSILNVRGGLLSMIPNVFPVVVIFGAMGHLRIVVDIGSMMTASVAMGVAVDDTIHFLTWFRNGVRNGMERVAAIKLAYDRCATAMTQTTLIGGVGLSVFAVSTFTPTQRFGVMMLAMLLAALVGDLVLLPALLASPWGRFFCPKPRETDAPKPTSTGEVTIVTEEISAFASAAQSTSDNPDATESSHRIDAAHDERPAPHSNVQPAPKTN